MPDSTIDYAEPRPPMVRRLARWWLPITCCAGFAIAALVSTVLPVRQFTIWMDPVTGSQKRQLAWFGISAGPIYQKTLLESRLHATGYTWPQTWHFVSKTDGNLWGHNFEWEDGSAPSIYTASRYLDDYVKAATPEELKAFADTMRFGTEAQQESAIKAAFDKSLQSKTWP